VAAFKVLYKKKFDVAFFTSKKLDDTFNFSRLKSLEKLIISAFHIN